MTKAYDSNSKVILMPYDIKNITFMLLYCFKFIKHVAKKNNIILCKPLILLLFLNSFNEFRILVKSV